METYRKVGAVQLSARLRGVSPPVTRRLLITEQSCLAELHATLPWRRVNQTVGG
jgi:hypothetical protein